MNRTTEQSFNFKTDCFFCETNVDFEEKKKRRQGGVFRVTTLEAKDTVLQTCSERKDEWAEVVQARILHFYDLPAADAIYHQACSVNFRTKKQIPMLFASEQPNLKKRKIERIARKPIKSEAYPGEGSRGSGIPPKRNQLLRAVIEKEAANAKENNNAFESTRWVERHEAYEVFFDRVPFIVKTLEAISHE